jgi:metal-responsive CopG/Arc/MetJ family transcriptional regulator
MKNSKEASRKTRKPPKGKVYVLVSIKENLLTILTKIAVARDEPRTKVINSIIEEYLEDQGVLNEKHEPAKD